MNVTALCVPDRINLAPWPGWSRVCRLPTVTQSQQVSSRPPSCPCRGRYRRIGCGGRQWAAAIGARYSPLAALLGHCSWETSPRGSDRGRWKRTRPRRATRQRPTGVPRGALRRWLGKCFENLLVRPFLVVIDRAPAHPASLFVHSHPRTSAPGASHFRPRTGRSAASQGLGPGSAAVNRPSVPRARGPRPKGGS